MCQNLNANEAAVVKRKCITQIPSRGMTTRNTVNVAAGGVQTLEHIVNLAHCSAAEMDPHHPRLCEGC